MNHRQLSGNLIQTLYTQILNKMDKAESKDVFYLSMALGHGIGKKLDIEQIPKYSDVIYTLYVAAAKHI